MNVRVASQGQFPTLGVELWTYETTRGPATLRLARVEDIPHLIQLDKHCFPRMAEQNVVWNRGQLQNHIRLFPEGQIVVEMGGEILGACSSLIVRTDDYRPHTYSGITDGGYFQSHDPPPSRTTTPKARAAPERQSGWNSTVCVRSLS